MATPVRKYEERNERADRPINPINPVPPLSDPAVDPRFPPANDRNFAAETAARSQGTNTGLLIGAVVLAVIAYFVFSSGAETTIPADQPAVA